MEIKCVISIYRVGLGVGVAAEHGYYKIRHLKLCCATNPPIWSCLSFRHVICELLIPAALRMKLHGIEATVIQLN